MIYAAANTKLEIAILQDMSEMLAIRMAMIGRNRENDDSLDNLGPLYDDIRNRLVAAEARLEKIQDAIASAYP